MLNESTTMKRQFLFNKFCAKLVPLKLTDGMEDSVEGQHNDKSYPVCLFNSLEETSNIHMIFSLAGSHICGCG